MNGHDSMRNGPGDFALDEPLPLGATEPVDVVQVRADDALIAALGRSEDVQIDDPIDERLVGLLRAWREDVHAEPEPSVDVNGAVAALVSAPRPRARRQSPFGPLATAAAVLVVAFVGLGLAARDAEPGDALWGVTKVLYSEKAKSVEAAVTVRTKLEQASIALHTGNVTAAMVALQEAQQRLPVVNAEDGQRELASQTEQLLAELEQSAPGTLPPETSSPVVASGTTTASSSPTAEEPPTTTIEPTTVPPPPPPVTETPSSTGSSSAAAPGGGPPEGSSPKAGSGPSTGVDPSAGGSTSAEGGSFG